MKCRHNNQTGQMLQVGDSPGRPLDNWMWPPVLDFWGKNLNLTVHVTLGSPPHLSGLSYWWYHL